MSNDLIQTLATDWAGRDSGTKVATYRRTPLHAYCATQLQGYTPARIGKQRGARNGTPQHSWSLLLFSPEELLNLFLILLIIFIHPDFGATAGLLRCPRFSMASRYACSGLHAYITTVAFR